MGRASKACRGVLGIVGQMGLDQWDIFRESMSEKYASRTGQSRRCLSPLFLPFSNASANRAHTYCRVRFSLIVRVRTIRGNFVNVVTLLTPCAGPRRAPGGGSPP